MEEQANNNKHQAPPEGAPFGQMQSVSVKKPQKRSYFIAFTLGFSIVSFILGAFLIGKFRENSIRTLEEFPLETYYSNYTTLSGSRFKARLKAVGQIGWNEQSGKHVIFNVGSSEKPVVILVPPEVSDFRLETGKNFTADIQVSEGGRIKALQLIEN